jgi:hypothetical protein
VKAIKVFRVLMLGIGTALGISILLLSCSHSNSGGGYYLPNPTPIHSPGISNPTKTPAPELRLTPRPTPTARPRSTAFSCPGDIVNCSDFSTQAEAQRWFDRYYADCGYFARLDSDKDGIVREGLRGVAEYGSIIKMKYGR